MIDTDIRVYGIRLLVECAVIKGNSDEFGNIAQTEYFCFFLNFTVSPLLWICLYSKVSYRRIK